MVVGSKERELGARGLIYCYHDFQTELQRANGSTKVTYSHGKSAGELLVKDIKAAKKPEEALGLALRALVLATFADEECVANSSRSRFDLRYGNDEVVPDLLAAVAVKREVLPDTVRKAEEERRQLEAEEAELAVLEDVKASRAKAGAAREAIRGHWATTEVALDQAVDAKRLKEHEGDEPSYTLTAAGKKRLEKLKANEKERQAAK